MSSGVQIAPAPSKPAPSTGLPAIVLFDYDPAAIAAVNGIKHYLRVKFSQFTPDRQEEAVVITSYEQMIADNESVLRSPNVRVIALSNERFSNPRTDGLVYAYLPPDTSAAILERLIDNAVDHIHLLSSRRGVTDKLAGAQREIEDLNLIGASL